MENGGKWAFAPGLLEHGGADDAGVVAQPGQLDAGQGQHLVQGVAGHLRPDRVPQNPARVGLHPELADGVSGHLRGRRSPDPAGR